MSQRQSYYVGVKGIITNQNGGVLILKDAIRGKWELPGGRIDSNQSITEAFSREIEEEIVGSKAESLVKLIHAAQGDFLVEDKHRLLLLFYQAKVKLPEQIKLSGEHSDFAWVTRLNIKDYDLFSTDLAAIKMLP